jgi:Xaa-Pro aminopeptidase
MPDHEREEWIDAVLRREGLDAMVCGAPPNVLMLSGYWPVTGASVAVRRRRARTQLIVPEDETHFAAAHGEVVSFQPSSMERLSNATDAIREPLRAVLSKLGARRIGVEVSPVFVPTPYASIHQWGCALHNFVVQMCPDAEVIDATARLDELRARLTSAELDKVKHACAIAADAFAMARALITPGSTERQVAGSIQTCFHADDAARASGFAFCMSGPRSAHAGRAYAYTGVRRFVLGDLVLVHCNSYVDGYWTDITRTYCLGKTDNRKKSMYEAVYRARDRALEAIKPGISGADVDRAARASLEADGFGKEFSHGTGHGVGFAAIDHNAIPRLHPASTDKLEAGMVLNVEPAIYIEQFGGIRNCDVVAVTDHGTELLTPFQASIAEVELTS